MIQLPMFLDKIQINGFKIQHLYDVGACDGSWSDWVKWNCLQQTEFHLFEANSGHVGSLLLKRFDFHIATLSDEVKEVEFYTNMSTGDSYYKESTSYYDRSFPLKKTTTTLDKLIQEKNLPIPQFLKIDTQGSELDILRGATSILNQTEIIMCEMPIVQYNIGAPTISEYLEFFRSHDYIPVHLVDVIRAEETLIQLDMIFMKRSAKSQFLGENVAIRV
jgi:FkbM family methyltransferase